MMGLLWQTCTIARSISTTDIDGTPVISEEVVASNVPCRLDTQTYQYKRSFETINTGSHSEEMYGMLYLDATVTMDPTYYVTISGVVWQVVLVHRMQDYGSIHHMEVEVRSVSNR